MCKGTTELQLKRTMFIANLYINHHTVLPASCHEVNQPKISTYYSTSGAINKFSTSKAHLNDLGFYLD